MALIKNEELIVFDLEEIKRGDCIRVTRKGDTTARNGFVTEAYARKIRILYCNVQNNAFSYLEIRSEEVKNGLWAIDWTRDFETVNHYPESPADESGSEGGE